VKLELHVDVRLGAGPGLDGGGGAREQPEEVAELLLEDGDTGLRSAERLPRHHVGVDERPEMADEGLRLS
jgi:hypothetical protein